MYMYYFFISFATALYRERFAFIHKSYAFIREI